MDTLEDYYRFGFNGQEKDDEVFGSTGTSYTAEFWQYDTRIGRRWNLDPKPNPSVSLYVAFADNPIWFSDPFGDKIKITGGKEKRKNYISQLNEKGDGTVFTYDRKKGLQIVGDPKGDFGKAMEQGINDKQTIIHRLKSGKNSIFIDKFATGEVDIADLELITQPETFQVTVAHYTIERFAINNYENNKMEASSNGQFEIAHQTAIDWEQQFYQNKYPDKNVTYRGEGIERGSVTYGKPKTTIYVWNFTDVQRRAKTNWVRKIKWQNQMVTKPKGNLISSETIFTPKPVLKPYE